MMLRLLKTAKALTKRFALITLHLLRLTCMLCVCSTASFAQGPFNPERTDSISHLRAIPLYLAGQQTLPFTRHSVVDIQGYLWTSGATGILRYDGYETREFLVRNFSSTGESSVAYLFTDSEGALWAGDTSLHKFDAKNEAFDSYNVIEQRRVQSIVEDNQGYLWLATDGYGAVKFNKKTMQVVSEGYHIRGGDAPIYIHSLAYDNIDNILWMAAGNGIFYLDIENDTLHKVDTQIDQYFDSFFIRDIALDTKNKALWVGTPKGLLRINTDQSTSVLYTPTQTNKLPISDVSSTYVDKNGTLWVGLEKEGLCFFRYSKDDFVCLRSSFNEKNKLPFATVEDITEDASGNLWLSMNHYGISRISPNHDKFETLFDKFTNQPDDYFPHSNGGIVRNNADVWIPTDGGGINIFNYKTGTISTLKHDPQNPKSLSSNSVISITEDELGFIWAGTWAGGISRINPNTLESETITIVANAQPGKTVASNNVFVVASDLNGGIWLSAWTKGLQYYHHASKTFTNYLHEKRGGKSAIRNAQISHLTLYDNKVWIVGDAGFEMLDPATGEFTFYFSTDRLGFTYVYPHSYEEIWIGTRTGLIKYNAVTKEKEMFTTADGLSNNEIAYLTKDDNGWLWIATSDGVTIFDEKNNSFTRYFEQDGLASNTMSTHGEFFNVADKIYMPGKYGVTIIDPTDLPKNNNPPKTVITHLSFTKAEQTISLPAQELHRINNDHPFTFEHDTNNFKFDFSVLSFVFPERNNFMYRLVGLQNDFTRTNANERFARFPKLSPGKYIFEVYGSNSNDIWDKEGTRFSFIILSPWWKTWWAYALFGTLILIGGYLIERGRFALVRKNERALQQKVKEKTTQLETYASELKHTSESLAQLNANLEYRVEKRTAELQIEVNERKNAESKLFHMAFHDSLTGLHNREWIIDHIRSLIKLRDSSSSSDFGVMFLDGDRFKQINDTHGHSLGDRLLQASANRLRSLLSDGQYAARLGGDEFTVVVPSTDENTLTAFAQTIVEAFKAPFSLGKTTVYLNVSIGLVLVDARYTNVPNVLRDADIAMYRAKAAGKSRYQLFDSEMQQAAMEMAQLETELHRAVENNHFKLLYQPIVDLETGLLNGFEALIRWEHPEKGIISPVTFIPLAEETGLIWEIGNWVLHEACRQTKIWHNMGLSNPPSISVNISSNQLKNHTFLDLVDRVIEQTGIDSSYLKLELTESVLIENNHTVKKLFNDLSQRNIDLAIDDFGTGYSSLAYLNEIPVQFLKIDRVFIAAIDNNSDGEINNNALEVVKATISLGKSLSKQVTAEGIETATQLAALIRHGCDFVQGYHLSRPISSEQANILLTSEAHIDEGGVNICKSTFAHAYAARARLKQSEN